MQDSSLPRPPPRFESGSFTLDGIEWFGFDLDHTLARYKHEPTSQLIFDSLVKFLVRHRGYPKSLEDFVYDSTFITKGVVCDNTTGNFVTVDSEKRISGRRHFHGTRELVFESDVNDGVRADVLAPHIYPGPISEFDPLASAEPGKSDRFHSFITYFDMPAGHLYALLVDLRDRLRALAGGDEEKELSAEEQRELAAHRPLSRYETHLREEAEAPVNPFWYKHEQLGNRKLIQNNNEHDGEDEISKAQQETLELDANPAKITESALSVKAWAGKSYAELWGDLLGGFRHNFGDVDRGYYFPPFFRDPGRFIFRRPDVQSWLWRLRNLYGKKLLLITNSRYAYAHCLLSFMFGSEQWEHWFDLSVVWGRKPSFWTGNHPFVRVRSVKDLDERTRRANEQEFRELCFAENDPAREDAVCYYHPQTTCLLGEIVEKLEVPEFERPERPDPRELSPAGPLVAVGNFAELQKQLFPDCPCVRASEAELLDARESPVFHIGNPGEDISAGNIALPSSGNDNVKTRGAARFSEDIVEDDSVRDQISGIAEQESSENSGSAAGQGAGRRELPGTDPGARYLRAGHRCRAVYFGDNLRTDVMAVKLFTSWFTVAVLEELEELWPLPEPRLLPAAARRLRAPASKQDCAHQSDESVISGDVRDQSEIDPEAKFDPGFEGLEERLRAAADEAARELPALDHGRHFPASGASICQSSAALKRHLEPTAVEEARVPCQSYPAVKANPNWGSFFLAGSDNPAPSYWHDFVRRHANLAVADVTDLIDVAPLNDPALNRAPDHMRRPLRYAQPEDLCYWPASEPGSEQARRRSIACLEEAALLVRSRVQSWEPPRP